jgi:hypothetical protein
VFIRYPDSYRKVGDTLPCTLCMNIQWYAGAREDRMAAQLSAAKRDHHRAKRPDGGGVRRWRAAGATHPAGSATQRAGGLEKLALGGGG